MRFIICFIIVGLSLNSFCQDIDGKWVGNFTQYVHEVYDVEMIIKKLPYGNVFTARLKITNGYYFGEYELGGNICKKNNIEISAIFLIKENESSNWIDCLNGMFDLNEDENELTFTDTWLATSAKNNTCKIKYIQKDMFQCLRSAYLSKPIYSDEIKSFEDQWNEYANRTKKGYIPNSETKISAKNEEKAPVIDTFKAINKRPVVAKNEIAVTNRDITIEYWDKYNEDGDSISLFLNDKPVLQNVLLTKVKKSIDIHLEELNNFLVIFAINLGKEPPNTASITIKDGKKIQNVTITSDLTKSGALKIVLKK